MQNIGQRAERGGQQSRVHPLLPPVLLFLAVLGLILLGVGFWVLGAEGARRRFGPTVSDPTRYTIGVCLLIGGYHLVAFSLPDAWVPLKVPKDRWYLVPSVIVLALLGSTASDGLRRMSPEGNDPS